MLTITINIDK